MKSVQGYSKYSVPLNEAGAKTLRQRSLTNRYKMRPQWSAAAHTAPNTAVAITYEWDVQISSKRNFWELRKLNRMQLS